MQVAIVFAALFAVASAGVLAPTLLSAPIHTVHSPVVVAQPSPVVRTVAVAQPIQRTVVVQPAIRTVAVAPVVQRTVAVAPAPVVRTVAVAQPLVTRTIVAQPQLLASPVHTTVIG